ncbi:nuclear transport factor 2 family protein [Microbacterium tumbae]
MSAEEGPLDERLARLEDLEEIKRLAIAYKEALDGKDTAAYAELFAEDGTLWCTPELQATGRPGIRALVDSMSGGLLTEVVGTDFHAIANHLIDLDGDTADGSLTWLYFTVAADGSPRLEKIGHYVDRYVRERGVWRFQRREAPTDIPAI